MSTRSRTEVIRRVDIVYRLLLLGLRRAQIIETIETEYPAWGASPRAVDRYIHQARELLEGAGGYERQLEMGRALGRLHDLYARCVNGKAYRDALAVQKEINELLGLKAPLEVNINDARRELVDLLCEEVLREAEDATAGAARED